MPFDVDNTDKILRRRVLIEALRQDMKWKWNYCSVTDDCGTTGCAIGMAHAIWPDADFRMIKYGNNEWSVDIEEVGKFFGITEDQAREIFNGVWDNNIYKISASKVTPDMVAQALERTIGD